MAVISSAYAQAEPRNRGKHQREAFERGLLSRSHENTFAFSPALQEQKPAVLSGASGTQSDLATSLTTLQAAADAPPHDQESNRECNSEALRNSPLGRNTRLSRAYAAPHHQKRKTSQPTDFTRQINRLHLDLGGSGIPMEIEL